MIFFSLFQSIDAEWFSFVYGLSYHSALFDAVGVFFAQYALYIVEVILALMLVWPNRNQARNRVIAIVSIVAVLIARYIVKAAVAFAFPRPRPFITLPNVHPLVTTLPWERLQSFPSGHALIFFSLATVLYCFNKKVGWWAFVAAALVSIARVYVGVHWPTDVLVGAVLGILTGWLVFSAYQSHAKYLDTRIATVFKFLHLQNHYAYRKN